MPVESTRQVQQPAGLLKQGAMRNGRLHRLALVVAMLCIGGCDPAGPPLVESDAPVQSIPPTSPRDEARIVRAIEERARDMQVDGSGVVTRLLRDDNDGSRHQRFVLRIDSGQTLLVAHNIDLAPRLAPLAVGDEVQFRGEYDWTPQGGVIHWTHADPDGRHRDGWIRRATPTLH